MRTFTLVTPVGRRRLLASVAAAVAGIRPHPAIRLRWICDFKNPDEVPEDYAPVCRRAEVIFDGLTGPGWFMWMSDDSMPEPDVLWKLMTSAHDMGLVLGHQQLEDGTVRLATQEILRNAGPLDLGQGIIDIEAHRAFGVPVFSMGWERHWLKAFAIAHGVTFIDDIISHHDALRVR